MAAITQQIPNLLGGASQQPDPVKLPGQVREAKNVLLDPTFGCKKRPPLRFTNLLATNIPSTTYNSTTNKHDRQTKWFPIIRDENEHYVACVYRGTDSSTYYKVTVDSNNYKMDGGSANATLALNEKSTYIFDQSDSSNTGKPLRISTTADGTHGGGTEYTTNVTTYGTPGSPGAFTKITVAASAPTLYYYDTSTASAGGQLTTSVNSTYGTHIRVWDAKTGHEKKVEFKAGAADYLWHTDSQNIDNINFLTVNDYTFIANSEKTVNMSDSSSSASVQEALVVINQVAYNTNYNVDFLQDGTTQQQVKVYDARRLSISDGSWEDTANGNCSGTANQNFTENHASDGSKTGLGFNITVNCTPTAVQTEIEGVAYPRHVEWVGQDTNNQKDRWPEVHNSSIQAFFTKNLPQGSADNYAIGSGPHYDTGNISVAGVGTIQLRFIATVEEQDNQPWYRIHTDSSHDRYNKYVLIDEDGADEESNWEQRRKSNGTLKYHHKYVLNRIEVLGHTTVSGGEWKAKDDEGYNLVIRDETTLSSDLYKWEYGDYKGHKWPSGSLIGMQVDVTNTQRNSPTYDTDYKSVYNARVTLTNRGVGWRQGDSVTVTASGHTYTVTVEEEGYTYTYASESSVSFTSPQNATSGQLNIGAITASLVTDINALSNYSAEAIGNIVYIKRDDSRSFNLQTRGGTTDNALYGIKGSVDDISMLPQQCKADVVLKVRNTAESDDDDYYVKFIPSAGNIPGHGTWEECVAPGTTTDLNASTMPHAMIRLANGDFEVRPLSQSLAIDDIAWSGREVGDTNTNPDPSFIGRGISNMFFYQNRLGFLSEDAVILSQPGDWFNFFNSSAIAISDADPIDMTASATKPALLKNAIGTAKGLLLFAENSQFLMSTTESAFGPSTVKMVEVSNFAYTSKIPPVETGVSIMFSTEADTFSKVYELAVDSVDNRPVVSENTRIIPEYIPPNLSVTATSPNNSFVAFGNYSDTLYTFKFFNQGNERSLAGWGKWVLPAPCWLCTFAHDTGYMVLYNGTSFILTRLEMLDDPDIAPILIKNNKFLPRLDNHLFDNELTKTVGSTTTKVYFPEGSYVVGKTPNVTFTSDGSATMFLRPTIQSDSTGYFVEIDNKVKDEAFILGLEYDFEVELPTFHVVNNKRSDRRNPPMVENVYLDLYLSGRYSVTVKRLGYDDINMDLEVTDADIYLSNDPAVQEISTRAIPVFMRGDQVYLTVKASDPLPASITSYSWEGHYNNRGISLLA